MIDPIGGEMRAVGAAAAGDGLMALTLEMAKALCYEIASVGLTYESISSTSPSFICPAACVTVLITNSGQSTITSDVLGAQSRAAFCFNRQITGDGSGMLEKHFQQKEIKTFSSTLSPQSKVTSRTLVGVQVWNQWEETSRAIHHYTGVC
jgi:hypothetical protein